jgi:hypothetical protein
VKTAFSSLPGGPDTCHEVVDRPKIVLVDNRHRGLVEEVNQERDGDEACLTAKRSIEEA